MNQPLRISNELPPTPRVLKIVRTLFPCLRRWTTWLEAVGQNRAIARQINEQLQDRQARCPIGGPPEHLEARGALSRALQVRLGRCNQHFLDIDEMSVLLLTADDGLDTLDVIYDLEKWIGRRLSATDVQDIREKSFGETVEWLVEMRRRASSSY